MFSQTADLFTEESAEQFENDELFYDMMAVADDGLVSIDVVFENLGVLYGTALSEEQYMETSAGYFEEQFSAGGFENIEWEGVSVKFAGAEHVGMHFKCTMQDMPYYRTQVYIKSGNYMASISFCSFYEDIGEELMANFFAL